MNMCAENLAIFNKNDYYSDVCYPESGSMKILVEKCKRCLTCVEVCPVKAISKKGDEVVIDKEVCLSCGCCASGCPHDAIEFE